MTFEITPGTIYSAHFPFSDLRNKKKRPVLALSGKDENDDVRIAFIAKTSVAEAQGFALELADFADQMPTPPVLSPQSSVLFHSTLALSATSPPVASTLHTTSPWVKAA